MVNKKEIKENLKTFLGKDYDGAMLVGVHKNGDVLSSEFYSDCNNDTFICCIFQIFSTIEKRFNVPMQEIIDAYEKRKQIKE